MRGRRSPWVVAAVAALLVLAGCGGSSIESKVSDRYDQKVESCRAVGLVDEGKIYSCQSEGSTLCVVVDGGDVFDARAKAEQAGIAC